MTTTTNTLQKIKNTKNQMADLERELDYLCIYSMFEEIVTYIQNYNLARTNQSEEISKFLVIYPSQQNPPVFVKHFHAPSTPRPLFLDRLIDIHGDHQRIRKFLKLEQSDTILEILPSDTVDGLFTQYVEPQMQAYHEKKLLERDVSPSQVTASTSHKI